MFTNLIVILLAIQCYGQSGKIHCKDLLQEGFKNIVLEPSFISIKDKDTIRINELKFTCVTAGRYSQIALYDKFGKWSSLIQTKDEIPLLVWKDVKLFKTQDKKYTVLAHGVQNLYTSFMVFDENMNDMLSSDSEDRDELIKYFKKLIRKNSSKKSNFCKDYNEELRPENPLTID